MRGVNWEREKIQILGELELSGSRLERYSRMKRKARAHAEADQPKAGRQNSEKKLETESRHMSREEMK